MEKLFMDICMDLWSGDVTIEYSVLTKLPVQYFGNHDSGNRKLS